MSEELRLVLESNQLIIRDRIASAEERRNSVNKDSRQRIRGSRYNDGDFIEKAKVIDKQITEILERKNG